MSSMFGGSDNAQAKALEEQEAAAKKKELQLAKELASRRRVAGQSSKTLFKAVEGTGDQVKKKTKLGE